MKTHLKFAVVTLLLAVSATIIFSGQPLQAQIAPITDQSMDMKSKRIYARAVEGAIWGIPLVNVDAMRQAYFTAGATYNDAIYWSNANTWMNQTTTPNHSTSYVMFFVNLKDGPVVVDVPAAKDQALYGTLINCWNEPMINVGNTGYDQGKGAKYLLLPPGYKDKIPKGYIPVQSTNYNNYSLLRIIVKTRSAEDLQKGIAYLKTLKIYPLADAASPKPVNFIDVSGKPFEALPQYNSNFYVSLARMIQEEPVHDRDLAVMGQLYLLGLGKDLKFSPDEHTKALLDSAAEEAHQWMMEQYALSGTPIWPATDRKWTFLLDIPLTESTKVTFLQPGRDLRVDIRSGAWFAMFGPVVPPPPQLYIKTYETKDGRRLNGSNTYHLHVAANVPTSQFWAVDVYDAATAAFIRQHTVVGLDSYKDDLRKNADGTVDVYFGPKSPAGQESNWIPTLEGKDFFVMFRIYGPEKGAVDGSWILDNIEEVK